jgi:AbiV family abortive infection protein
MTAMNKGSSVSAVTLVYGLWYAIEQCGVLLNDAVQLFERASFPTALALALLANEELGKSIRLLNLWEQIENGNPITSADVEDAVRSKKNVHQQKQRAALAESMTAGAGGTEIGRLLAELIRSSTQMRDARFANGEPAENLRAELLADPRMEKLARNLNDARKRVLYVNFDSSSGAWSRPRDEFGTEVKALASWMIFQVSNSYANYPSNLLQGTRRPKLAAELNSWPARPALPWVVPPRL